MLNFVLQVIVFNILSLISIFLTGPMLILSTIATVEQFHSLNSYYVRSYDASAHETLVNFK